VTAIGAQTIPEVLRIGEDRERYRKWPARAFGDTRTHGEQSAVTALARADAQRAFGVTRSAPSASRAARTRSGGTRSALARRQREARSRERASTSRCARLWRSEWSLASDQL
jgi:hypothetical protein